MRKKVDTYFKARLEILNWVVVFMAANYYEGLGGGFLLEKKNGFHSSAGGVPIPVGTLVRLSAAKFSKWYLSWLVEFDKDNDKYLLKSIEDGSLCWWSNVMVSYVLPEVVELNYHWKWTDDQYQFEEKWRRACNRRDPYIVLPLRSVFNDDGSVTLGTRIKFSFKQSNTYKTFPDWKKLKSSEMLTFYDECVRLHEEKK